MTPEQEIADLKQRLDKLEQDELAPLQASMLHLRAKFTPSGYLDVRYQPQLTGDVRHLAGTEPILVAERFEFINPVNDTGIGTIDITASETKTVIDVSETGTLIGIGVVVSGYSASGGTADVFLDVTIDDGTTQSFQLVFADLQWGKTIQPLVTVGDVPQSGNADGHALYMPMNLEYGSHLEVALRSEELTAITGAYAHTATVYRGRKVPTT